MLGLAGAQRFVRSGCVRGPISAAAGCLFDLRSRTAKAESLPICEVRVRISAPVRAAVIFVPSLNRMILSAKVVVQRKRGSGTGRGSAGRVDANRSNLDQSGLFWLLSPRLATGYMISLPLWGHIKSFYVIRTGNEGAYGA